MLTMIANAGTFLQLAVFATAIKLLLVPTYRSTDFEVHRNWLAITHSLPISKWYIEETSEWTLDYPPFFAWFEWALSQIARFVDPAMLVVQNLGHASGRTVMFQRFSVIVTDVVLLAAAYALARDVSSDDSLSSRGGDGKSKPKKLQGPGAQATGSADETTPSPTTISNSVSSGRSRGNSSTRSDRSDSGMQRSIVLFFLLSCNAGLLLVDHVHFQYNGVMIGLLLWSLYAARSGRHLLSGLLFAALLNMKHLFLYAAPAYFVYLLRHYCCEGTVLGPACAEADSGAGSRTGKGSGKGSGSNREGFRLGRVVVRLVVLGAGVLTIFGVSFGPFITMRQMPQVLRRLFPFGRGLLHAYWAANVWAPYAAADKLLAAALPRVAPRLGLELDKLGLWIEPGAANMAGGLVKVSRFAVLPQVSPAATALAVLLALVPCLAAFWAGDGRPGYVRRNIVRAVSYSFLSGFVFGYHVHEKAVLVALLPHAVDAVLTPSAARRFLLLATAGHYGLLPLIFRPQEYGTKILVLLSYLFISMVALGSVHAEVRLGAREAGVAGEGVASQSPLRPSKMQGSSTSPAKLGMEWETAKSPMKGTAVLGRLAKLYLAGFLVVELYVSIVHEAVPALRRRLPFAPLMLTSVYCSIGVLAVWVDMVADWVCETAMGWRKHEYQRY
ncbi:hypothetical protein Vretimale_12732 [Volvox reticuliferus]|uniref:Alpha-1,3-glucosyltransferase n=1 Tax=Volvox reticuliferus TaxID=1737510 RepID=A0A8J4GIX5_9CHLO|nr:hypothetical protein Vretimale_12732 [Volvox reticuliferus]